MEAIWKIPVFDFKQYRQYCSKNKHGYTEIPTYTHWHIRTYALFDLVYLMLHIISKSQVLLTCVLVAMRFVLWLNQLTSFRIDNLHNNGWLIILQFPSCYFHSFD